MPEQIRLAVTIGDPAGIGPEVVLKALLDSTVRAMAAWSIIGDREALEAAARSCGLDAAAIKETEIVDPHLLDGVPMALGVMRADYGRAAMHYVRTATEMCL
ncbi:MAG TPA: hypothetical protein VKT75_07245, partial [Acidobacteriaceae bacterium]|nr:hypothetical protein [Acidobacteriaceae bacterium]